MLFNGLNLIEEVKERFKVKREDYIEKIQKT